MKIDLCVICKYRDHCAIKPFIDHFRCKFVKTKKKYIKEYKKLIKDRGNRNA